MIEAERQEAIKIILYHRSFGGSIEDCAEAAGIDQSTLHRWKKKDASFAGQLRQERAKYKIGLIRRVAVKKPDFLLEKQFSAEFGKKVGLDEPKKDTTIPQTTPEELATRLKRLLDSS